MTLLEALAQIGTLVRLSDEVVGCDGLQEDYSLNGRPLHLIRYANKPTVAMAKRQRKDEYARMLEKERRFAEAAAVEAAEGEE